MINMVLLITKPLKLFLNIPHVFLKGILKDDAHWNKDWMVYSNFLVLYFARLQPKTEWRLSCLEVTTAFKLILDFFLAKIPRPASIIASILALASSEVKKRSIFAVFMATHYNLSYCSVLHQMSIIPLGIYPGTPKVLPKNIWVIC